MADERGDVREGEEEGGGCEEEVGDLLRLEVT